MLSWVSIHMSTWWRSRILYRWRAVFGCKGSNQWNSRSARTPSVHQEWPSPSLAPHISKTGSRRRCHPWRTSDLKETPSPPSSSSVSQSSCYVLVHRLSLVLSPCVSTHQTGGSRISFTVFLFCFVFLFLSPKPSSCCCFWPKDHEC